MAVNGLSGVRLQARDVSSNEVDEGIVEVSEEKRPVKSVAEDNCSLSNYGFGVFQRENSVEKYSILALWEKHCELGEH